MNTIEVTIYIEAMSGDVEKDKWKPYRNIEIKFNTGTNDLEETLVQVLSQVERARKTLDP